MKILITNVYSYQNKGDAAIVLAMVNEVRRVFPDAELKLQTVDKESDADKYGAPVQSSLLWILLSSLRNEPLAGRILKLITRTAGLLLYLLLYRLFKKRATWLVKGELRDFVQWVHEADLVIACGGGYLRTSSTTPSLLLWLFVACLNFMTGHYLGKPIYMFSQSIGPLHDWMARGMVKFCLKRVQLIEVREDISLNFVRSLDIATPLVRTGDPAFLLRGHARKSPVELKPADLQVGITVRNWFSNEHQLMEYVKIVARVLDDLIEKHGARITYIPQVIATDFGDDDRLIAKKLWEQVKNNNKFDLVLDDYHPLELIGLCSQMDMFIGTRMHSNIFSLLSDVPVVAIMYEHKTLGIMQGLGVGDLTVDIETITYQELSDKVNRLLENRQSYKAIIAGNMAKQLHLSGSAMDIIKKEYENLSA